MPIVDAQVHIWGADTRERPWPSGRGVEAQKPYPVTKDMLRFEMELAKVDRIVLVPPRGRATAMIWPSRPRDCTPTSSR